MRDQLDFFFLGQPYMKFKYFRLATNFMKLTLHIRPLRLSKSPINDKRSNLPKFENFLSVQSSSFLLSFFKNGQKPLKLTKIFKNRHLPWIFSRFFQDSNLGLDIFSNFQYLLSFSQDIQDLVSLILFIPKNGKQDI